MNDNEIIGNPFGNLELIYRCSNKRIGFLTEIYLPFSYPRRKGREGWDDFSWPILPKCDRRMENSTLKMQSSLIITVVPESENCNLQ